MIAVADIHLRLTPPRARKDNYLAAQERKLRFILGLAQGSPPLVIAGDLFDLPQQPKGHEGLLRWAIDLFNEYGIRPIVTPGQHDLPGHSLDQIRNSSLGVLAAAGVIELLADPQFPTLHNDAMIEGVPYGMEPEQLLPSDDKMFIQVMLWHHMVIVDPLWPGQVADKVQAILRKYPAFDVIVTGDNHQSFAVCPVSKPNGVFKLPVRWLINPGSMMRMTAAQVSHKPCVYKWENGTVEQIFLPIEDDVLDLTDLNHEKEQDARISAYVERLNRQWEAGIEFERNLEQFFLNNPTKKSVEQITWDCCRK